MITRLRSPRICSWQAGDPEKTVVFRSSLRASRLQTHDAPIFHFEFEGKRRMSQAINESVKQSGRRRSFFLSLFVLFWSSTDWVRPTHRLGNNLLYLKATSFLTQNTHTEIPSIMFDQTSEHLLAQPS